MFLLLIRTGVFSRRKPTDHQRRTRRSCRLRWWRAAWLMIFHQSPPLGLVAGEDALLIPYPTSNTPPRCLSQTRLSWTSCVRESISQTWMRWIVSVQCGQYVVVSSHSRHTRIDFFDIRWHEWHAVDVWALASSSVCGQRHHNELMVWQTNNRNSLK